MEKHEQNLFINKIIFLLFVMANNMKKKMKLFRYLDKSISIQSSNRTEVQKSSHFLQERQYQRNPIMIKSFSKPKEDLREQNMLREFKLRCKSALNQSITFKPRGQRVSTPLYKTNTPFQSSQLSPKRQGQIQQMIKCKQYLKHSNRIHQDRWHMLSSIETKLVQEMQSNILKRQIIKNKCDRSAQITQQIKAKSLIKFNDLIQIKQVQVLKQTQKRQAKKMKLFGNKIKKKSAVLSRTQPSFAQSEQKTRNIRMEDTWKFFNRSNGRLSVNEQEITGWEIPADT